ncbi:conserved hypothetical protein [Verticillium alfalfae VaMs.102]|uniref:MAGE domain-containing protein n=1 Tax=Verticillium alfalfae (strain VaMs.102 / ATCC MYA-4576 / FGSC 10136) TaxID=526221 RepID=C9S9C5_VERA1|nr:conserved hypothetical protein [Verticillium alfalfae VaMs.102]EEY15988.1 conserved hypothetical protein [Verticillium alfalfae VaMs.102]
MPAGSRRRRDVDDDADDDDQRPRQRRTRESSVQEDADADADADPDPDPDPEEADDDGADVSRSGAEPTGDQQLAKKLIRYAMALRLRPPAHPQRRHQGRGFSPTRGHPRRQTPRRGGYVAFYTLLTTIILLSGGELSDAKLRRHLHRLNAEDNVGTEPTEDVLKRMQAQGYVVKRVQRDVASQAHDALENTTCEPHVLP